MSIPRKKFREMIFQLLYSHDLAGGNGEEMIPMMMEALSVSKSNMREAQRRMEEVVHHLEELDHTIAEQTQSYEPERIGRVERAVLRLGVYELTFDDGVPPKVAIAEALRLAKKFSTPESVKFVNAVLDEVRQAQGIEVEEVEEDKNATFFGD